MEALGMKDVTYRKLDWADIPQLIELRKQQLLEEGAEAVADISEPLAAYYKKHLSDGTFIAWLALKDNTIIATSGMSFVEKPPYYGNPSGKIGLISSMYTQKPYRRRGIAKRLLQLIMEEAEKYGCGAVHITASDTGVLLYKDFGFTENRNFLQYRFDTQ